MRDKLENIRKLLVDVGKSIETIEKSEKIGNWEKDF